MQDDGNFDVSSLSVEDRLSIAADERRLMAKYEQIILDAEKQEETMKTTEQESEPPTGWIVRTRRVQTYWDGNRTVRVRREELQDNFLQDFAAHQGQELEPASYSLDVLAENRNDNYWTVRVQAATAATADLIFWSLDEWLDYQVAQHNYHLTEQRGETLTVHLDPSLPVGANLVRLHRHGTAEGLFIEIKNPETALAQAVGNRLAHCVILKSVNGRSCPTIPIFKGVKRFARDRGEPLMLELQCLSAEDASLLWYKQPQDVENPDFPTQQEETNSNNTALSDQALVEENNTKPMKRPVPQPEHECASSNDFTQSSATDSAHLEQRPESPASSLTDNSQVSDPSLRRKSGNYDGYKHFHNKYGEIVLEEFKKGANIHKNAAMGYLWTQHKKLFGEACSEDCPCVKDLPALTSTVVMDQLEKKKSKWDNPQKLQPGDYPIGITGNFAHTFIPLLMQERPDEKSTKLLERLLAMWEIHRRNRIFGIKCHEGCECSEGWELVFHKGILWDEAGPVIKSSKESTSAAAAKASLRPIPKKRKTLLNASALVPGKKSKILPLSKPGQKPAPTLESSFQGNRWSAGSNGAQPLPQEKEGECKSQAYEIEFDCNKPLGFYCVTEKNPVKYCKIM